MTGSRKNGVYLLLLSCGISVIWALALDSGKQGMAMGFPGIYYGTQCLVQHCDPYNMSELNNFYSSQVQVSDLDSVQRRQSITLYVNLPPTFLVVAPFALLPFKIAAVIWASLTVASFSLAAYLVWTLGRLRASKVTLFLACIFLANAETIFAGGNTAGIVVSFSVIAVWCFLQNRFVTAGTICLAIALAIKPHDAGFVWLYFLLAGTVYRRRALQSAAIALVLAFSAILWVSRAAPHWIQEFRTNMSFISAHGGINDPGPASIGMRIPGMIIDLQTILSVIWDDPRFYNAACYFVCGILGSIWLWKTVKSRFSTESAWLALASVSALTMLVTYHRPYDAKLLLLTVPACAILWARGGKVGWIALLLTTTGTVMTGDLPLAILMILTEKLKLSGAGIGQEVLALLLTRPLPLILLSISIFYLWVYVRQLAKIEELALAEVRAPV